MFQCLLPSHPLKEDDATVTIKTDVPNFSLLKERLHCPRCSVKKSAQDDMKKRCPLDPALDV